MNRIYYGDNLQMLRDHVATGSVDLVYLDPPFNSNASYKVLFKGPKGDESPIPRIQIVPIERALKERERAAQVPLRHSDADKKTPVEHAPDLQGKLGL